MEKYYKKTIITSIAILVLSVVFSPFVEGTSFAIKYINTLFSFSMFACIVGGLLFVVGQGFFNVTKYGMKKLAKTNKKKPVELLEEDNQDLKDVLYERNRYSLTIPFLVSGIILSVLTTIISLMI
ncbi:DUF3899 domain-containing protein [Priestia taiwanensis]|uniref:DUF3899 domain-containing protein n=1 Tax=Priestia taiwanensis TaxID=1347902 RepID=A0A917AT37_9BACI|nr:DUF3899 domain-containing protein [Priestia taiwanensis]MBM7364169.1 hypothetical protein [Priestia taiwanensis]GGE72185.1 hypothetical protein GCM10007140_22650 [Priestia taiwanensis]